MVIEGNNKIDLVLPDQYEIATVTFNHQLKKTVAIFCFRRGLTSRKPPFLALGYNFQNTKAIKKIEMRLASSVRWLIEPLIKLENESRLFGSPLFL